MKEKFIQIELDDRTLLKWPAGSTPLQIAEREELLSGDSDCVGALVNNQMVSLAYPMVTNSHLHFLTRHESLGELIYRNSALLLLSRAIQKLFPKREFAVEHSLSGGFYCTLDSKGSDPSLAELESHLMEIIKADTPITRHKHNFGEVIERFRESLQTDRINLLRYRNPPKIHLYHSRDHWDIAHTPLLPRTGMLEGLRLKEYADGFIIQLTKPGSQNKFPPFRPSRLLFKAFQEHSNWGKNMGLRTAGDINRFIAKGQMRTIIEINESFQEKGIIRIADKITKHHPRAKWITVSGPSSSGKTTFSKRLALHLQADGIQTETISLDNYFVDRTKTPRNERGDPDYEHIQALDMDLLDKHLAKLQAGGQIELPKFNFATGLREETEKILQDKPAQIIIIEGIHGLNPRISNAIPPESIVKIYLSALTNLNLDSTNRISTTDNRLIRRIVRDNRSRAQSARRTLKIWPQVHAGESRWIFPYQNEADIVYNSALDYELAVLKPYIDPLLTEVKPYHPEYAEAKRLQDFLANFLVSSSQHVPHNSILREFIGHRNCSA